MKELEYFKSEEIRRQLLYLSIGLYIVAAALPISYNLSNFCPFIGFIFMLFGCLAFLGGTDFWMIDIFWLASPFLFISWYYYQQKPIISLICASVSVICWGTIFPFFIKGKWYVWLGPEFYNILLIYFLGLLGIVTMLIASLKQFKIQRECDSI